MSVYHTVSKPLGCALCSSCVAMKANIVIGIAADWPGDSPGWDFLVDD